MFEQNYIFNVLIASIYFVIAVKSFELSQNIRKCKPDDNVCFSNLFLQLIQNGKDYPELNIPDLEHYQPKQTWTVETRNHDLLNSIGFTAHHSDISLYGLKNFQMLQFSDFSLNHTDIYMELLFPWVKSGSKFNAELSVLSLIRIPASGRMNSTLTSVKVRLNLKNEITQRNGEQFLQIKSIDSSIQILDDFKADLRLNTRIPEIIQDAAEELTNSKWKQFKPMIETHCNEYISEILHETLTPVFAKVPYKDFFL